MAKTPLEMMARLLASLFFRNNVRPDSFNPLWPNHALAAVQARAVHRQWFGNCVTTKAWDDMWNEDGSLRR